MVIRYEVESRNEDDGQILYYLYAREARLLGQYYLANNEDAPELLFKDEPQLLAAEPGKEQAIETVLALSGLNITGKRKLGKVTDIF